MVTTTTRQTEFTTVPRVFAGQTVVCVGTGPSLTQAQVDFCRGKAAVLAVKNAFDLAPWADVVYGAGVDSTNWWGVNGARVAAAHQGLRFTLDPQAAAWASLLKIGPPLGLSSAPDTLNTGQNSGYQAINLAVHLGASRVLLLGYDMKPVAGRDHFFGAHPTGNKPVYRTFLPHFKTLVEPLQQLGVVVINCTPDSALESFPKMTLTEALA